MRGPGFERTEGRRIDGKVGATRQELLTQAFEVHHVDQNHLNSVVKNLALLKRSEHRRLHAGKLDLSDRRFFLPRSLFF